MYLIQRPYSEVWSRNRIRYLFYTASPTVAGCYLQAKLFYKQYGAATYGELETVFEMKPSPDGYVRLDIQQYIDAVLTYKLPDLDEAITTADEQAAQFYVEYREITDASPDPSWTSDSSNVIVGLKGGIEKHKWDGNNSLAEGSIQMLIWEREDNFIFLDEGLFLTYRNDAVGVHDLTLRVKRVYTDGSYVQTDTAFEASSKLYHLNINDAIYDFSGDTGNLHYLLVSVINTESEWLTKTLKYYFEKRPSYVYYDLIFHNSLGGLQKLRVVGETDISYDRSFEELENETGKLSRNILLRRKYKGDAGYLKNRNKWQQEALMEMLAAESIYMIIDVWFIAVANLQQGQTLGSWLDKKQSFPLEWALSESNTVFTPEGSLFGFGTDSFIIPINFQVDSAPVVGDNKEVTVSWLDVLPDVISYTIKLHNLTNPGDPDVLFEDITESPYEFTCDKDFTWEVSIKAIYANGESDYSPVDVF